MKRQRRLLRYAFKIYECFLFISAVSVIIDFLYFDVPIATNLCITSHVQNNILKIRKVYDAFLAEFPLCYGYWKKYADHEANMGSIDKVVEVYERAVQGVTYSVEIWLHYCIFAISTYGDPDTVRR